MVTLSPWNNCKASSAKTPSLKSNRFFLLLAQKTDLKSRREHPPWHFLKVHGATMETPQERYWKLPGTFFSDLRLRPFRRPANLARKKFAGMKQGLPMVSRQILGPKKHVQRWALFVRWRKETRKKGRILEAKIKNPNLNPNSTI